MEFVGALAAAVIVPGAKIPLAVASTGISLTKALRRHNNVAYNDASLASTSNSIASSDGVTLTWRAINCSRADPKGEGPPKRILLNIAGEARPGRILAILGPSGSGKTTLLNALAFRIPAAKGLSLSGEVLCNGRAILPELAYVTQEDLFFSELSVEETLQFAAQMRLPDNVDQKEFVTQLLRQLSLNTTQSTRVGISGGGAGISGGERKRLSLGCELISTPKLILCDEPTSGLDAFQALRVMQSLKKLADAGHTVIISIHQPSSAVFETIDDIALLCAGSVVYTGPREEAPGHFAKFGHGVPPNCNPAEHYLDLISVDNTSDGAASKCIDRIAKLVAGFATKQDRSPIVNKPREGTMSRTIATPTRGPFAQFRALLLRAFRQARRDKKTNVSRFMSSFMSSLLFGSIFWKMGVTQSAVQDRLGLLQVCTINTAMSALVKTLNVFPKEATLVNRERVEGAYGVLPYFTSKLCAELPIAAAFPLVFSSFVYPMAGLSGGVGRISKFAGIITLESFAAASYGLVIGAAVPNTDVAVALGPATFVLQIVFGGLYITQGNVPKWAAWLPKISIIKHTFEALCVNELRGLKLIAENPGDVAEGQQVLERMTWGDSTVAQSTQRLLRIVAFNYLAAFSILKLKQPRFQQMIHPKAVEDPVQIEDITPKRNNVSTQAESSMNIRSGTVQANGATA